MVKKLVGNEWSAERREKSNVLGDRSLNNWNWGGLAGEIRHELTPKKITKTRGIVKQDRLKRLGIHSN